MRLFVARNRPKTVDAMGGVPYMRPQQAVADLQGPASVRASTLSVNRCPERFEPGLEARRLFDIVGFDEGTCGRRPGLLEPPGSG